MGRQALKTGVEIVSKARKYVVNNVIGAGATSIVYHAVYYDEGNYKHNVILKECYPFASNINREEQQLVWMDDNREADLRKFLKTYEKLIAFQNDEKFTNSMSHTFDVFQTNGTIYSVFDLHAGVTFEQEKSLNLQEIVATVLALAKTVKKYHEQGYLHLDIKPSNFLTLPNETRELIILFDFDTVTAIEDIKDKKVKCVPYSKGWAAPEQMQGRIDKICFATDIYSIGAILFEKLMGQSVEVSDMSVFADWTFEGRVFEKVNPKVKRLLREIFHKTLSANIKRRYDNIQPLIDDLEMLKKTSGETMYLLSECPISEINFIGRNQDLASIDRAFSSGIKVVFLQGSGGVGKTELVKKYAELNKSKYDAIIFNRYDEDRLKLKDIIDNIKIVNEDESDSKEHRKHLRMCCVESRVLLVFDNYDVEPEVESDEDLEYLFSLDADIIFTSRYHHEDYYANSNILFHEVGTLSTEELVKLFKKEYGKDLSEEEDGEIRDVIERFDNWTQLIPIIAKSLTASNISIQELSQNLVEDGFVCIDEEVGDIRIRINGQSLKKSPLNLFRWVYRNLSKLSEKEEEILRSLYALQWHKSLSKELFQYYTKSKNLSALNDLIFKNWVLYSKEDEELSLHQNIKDLIKSDMRILPGNTPGLYQYIVEVFQNLKNKNLEEAKTITFALITHTEFELSEADEITLYTPLLDFCYHNFYADINGLYDLLCERPIESSSYMYLDSILSYLQTAVLNNVEGLSDKKDSIAIINEYIRIVQFLILRKSFFWLEGRELEPNKVSDFIIDPPDLGFDENQTDGMIVSILLKTLWASLYAPLKGKLIFDKGGCLNFKNECYYKDIGLNGAVINYINENNYAYYLNLSRGIQSILKNVIAQDVNLEEACDFFDGVELPKNLKLLSLDECYDLLEEFIIDIENSLGRFSFYGQGKDYLLSYIIPSDEEYLALFDDVKKLHWSKKAKLWYQSVEIVLSKVKNPYPIYKLLLNWNYHDEYLGKAKTAELLKNNFYDLIISDGRLDDKEKQKLLLEEVSSQIVEKRHITKTHRRELYKQWEKLEYKNILNLYSRCLECLFNDDYINPNVELTKEQLNSLHAMAILNNFFLEERFRVKELLFECINIINIKWLVEFYDIRSVMFSRGKVKGNKEIKERFFNVCSLLPTVQLPEEKLQFILYKLENILHRNKKDDVLLVFQSLKNNYNRKYNIDLIASNFLSKRETTGMLLDLFVACLKRLAAIVNRFFESKSDIDRTELLDVLMQDEEFLILKQTVISIINENSDRWANENWKLYPYLYQTLMDLLNQENPFDISALLYEFPLYIEEIKGIYLYYMSYISKDCFNDSVNDEFFFDYTEDERVTKEDRLEFKNQLISLRPDLKNTIEKLF